MNPLQSITQLSDEEFEAQLLAGSLSSSLSSDTEALALSYVGDAEATGGTVAASRSQLKKLAQARKKRTKGKEAYRDRSKPTKAAKDKDKPSPSSMGTFSDAVLVIQLSDLFSIDPFLTTGEPDSQKKYLKVPVAVLGEWEHPEYGHIEFTQADFDQMQSNFSSNVSGYEPPLFLGHPKNVATQEGAPATGFLAELEQDGDVLYGYWEMVDDEVYEDVATGKYRYSSAELIRPAQSKETGEEIGTLLIGAALTNRPFLTRMPRVEPAAPQGYSDCTEYHTGFLFALEAEPPAATSDMSQPTTSTTPAEAAVAETQSAAPQASTAPAFDPMDLLSRLEAAEAQARAANEQLAARVLSEKIAGVKSLNLSQSTKDWVCQMLSEGNLATDAEKTMLDGLHKLAEENNQLLLEQKGSTEETDKVNAPERHSVNPFEHILSENAKKAEVLAERRRAATLNLY